MAEIATEDTATSSVTNDPASPSPGAGWVNHFDGWVDLGRRACCICGLTSEHSAIYHMCGNWYCGPVGCEGTDMHPSKAKGDRAEREVETLIGELLGYPARRKLGAGRKDDTGDIEGIPDVTIQVANWPADTLGAVRHKPLECELQRERAGTTFAATFVRLRGGDYRIVLTPAQWATYLREAQ